MSSKSFSLSFIKYQMFLDTVPLFPNVDIPRRVHTETIIWELSSWHVSLPFYKFLTTRSRGICRKCCLVKYVCFLVIFMIATILNKSQNRSHSTSSYPDFDSVVLQEAYQVLLCLNSFALHAVFVLMIELLILVHTNSCGLQTPF